MAPRLRAPFPWYGSKLQAAGFIEQLHGPIVNLVIPCLGSGGELLGRSRPADVETANDIDGFVVNAWRAIKHAPERVAELVDQPVHELTLHAVHDKLVSGRTTKGGRKRSLKSGRRGTVSLAEYLRADEHHFDVHIAAKWIWGASCWLGSGWCKEPSRKRPALSGQGDRPHFGRGVVRTATSRQMPMLSGSYTGHPAHGQGVHSSAHRHYLTEWMLALAERLRFVRLICGPWQRAVTEALTTSHGLTGISFDPPYDVQATGRSARLYRKDHQSMSSDVRAWGIEHGDDPMLRIVLCGKGAEHDQVLEHGWSKHVWRNDGETIWASPHCCPPAQLDLWGTR